MQDFDGKYIWIIGCSSGIGAALARTLSDQGGRLALSARTQDKLEDLNTEMGGGHLVCPLDIADSKATQKTAEQIKKTFPKLDSVILFAALYTPGDDKPQSLDFIDKLVQVNLGGAFNMLRSVEPLFEAQGRGQIVLCGSVAGYRGLPGGQPYSATKAAIINLAESLKIELEPKNIDVKLINPGFVETPLTAVNKFPMPMIIDADSAARSIAKGLNRKAFEIHFPKKFTMVMKVIRILPNRLYFMMARKLRS